MTTPATTPATGPLWTRARHAETGGEGIVPVAALPNMPGWEAFGEPAERQFDLQVQIEQERIDAEEAAAARTAEAAEAAREGVKIDDVVELVGDDPEAAAAALAAEREKDKPRTTLVERLEGITEQAEQPPADTEGS